MGGIFDADRNKIKFQAVLAFIASALNLVNVAVLQDFSEAPEPCVIEVERLNVNRLQLALVFFLGNN